MQTGELRAGLRAKSQIPNFPINPDLTKCQTNLCTNYCKFLPTHGRNTVTNVLFMLFLSHCHFSETIAIRGSLAGFRLCGLGTNRFRTVGSRARARPQSIPSCWWPFTFTSSRFLSVTAREFNIKGDLISHLASRNGQNEHLQNLLSCVRTMSSIVAGAQLSLLEESQLPTRAQHLR